MKRLLIGLGLVCALVTVGHSQEDSQEDPILRQYGLAFSSLEASVAALAQDDSVSAREELDGLENTLRVLQPETTSVTIVDALESTIGLAQTSIQNRSQTDLSVQVAVLEGGFWRLVYESAISAADQGDIAVAKGRLLQIATDMNLTEETLSAIEATQVDAAGAPLTMLTLLEQGVASEVTTKLAAANELVATDRDASYIQLAEAYSLFIPVQDSPRAVGNETQNFEDAFALIVEPESIDTEAFSTQISELTNQMSQFAEAASAGLNTPTEAAQAAANEAGLEATTDAATEAVTDGAAEATAATVSESVAAEAAAPETGAPEVAAPEVESPATATPDDNTPAVPDAALTDAPPVATAPVVTESSTSELESEFGRYGLAANRQRNLARTYLNANYNSVEDALNALYAQSAKITVAVETGNQERAKTLLLDMDELYSDYAEPLVANNSFNSSVQALFNTLGSSPVLRLQDTAVLSGHIEALDTTLNGGSVPGLHNAIVTTTNLWAGWVRTVVVILLGLLALFPLYLLRLAFGGGNRNWQLIGGALLCLLLPLMFEGLSHLLVLISQAAGGISVLDTLASFSIFQNEISQVVWALLSALAIGLATAGLYGICVQFGLLGRRTASAQATSLETSATNTAINTSFDWDEEF